MKRLIISAFWAIMMIGIIACSVTADDDEILNVGPPAKPVVNKPVTNREAARANIEETLANAAAMEEQVFGGPATINRTEPEAEEPPEAAEPEAEEPPEAAGDGGPVRCGLFVDTADLILWWRKACAGASALGQAAGDGDAAKLLRDLASLIGDAINRAGPD